MIILKTMLFFFLQRKAGISNKESKVAAKIGLGEVDLNLRLIENSYSETYISTSRDSKVPFEDLEVNALPLCVPLN